MAYEFIETQQTEGVLVITMTDPRTRNSISQPMADEIYQELDRFEKDPEGRVLVLTGKDPAFCSGANVRGMERSVRDRESAVATEPLPLPWELMDRRYTPSGQEATSGVRFVPLRLQRLQKPSIAAVNGAAYGLGMGLALSCDIRIASESARFSEAFIRNGLIPADGSCWQLPRMIGLSNTFLLQYTGDAIAADEAHRLGLCSRVVPHAELMDATLEMARRLAQGPTFAMGLIKYLVLHSLSLDLEASLKLAGPAQELARATEDHREGVRAFVEKRTPQFKGR